MGRHMMQCAAVVELDNPRLKLALMCFAESARDTDGVTFPGYDELLKWSGVKRSQLHNLINRLIELQILERSRRPCRYRRTEYRLFPNGCCEVHGKRPATVVEDGATVVGITGEAISTGGSVHAQSVDPLPGSMGPVSPVNGSSLAGQWVQSPSVETAPSHKHSQNIPPDISTGPEQPLLPRETSAVSIDFAAVDRPLAGRQVQPSGFALGCRHCDAGYVCDDDGLPVAKCQHCHPAHRARGATA